MSYCPLCCSQHGNMPRCEGNNCELTDDAGECLVKQALSCYVQEKREARAAREALEKTTYADIFDAFFMPKGAKQEPAGAQKLKEMRSDDPIPPRYY